MRRRPGRAIASGLALVALTGPVLHASSPSEGHATDANATRQEAGGRARSGDVDPFPDTVAWPADRPPNTLGAGERAEGWRLLFDGVSGTGWRGAGRDDFPERGWTTSDGTLTVRAATLLEFRAGGDLFTTQRFGDFVLDFEFRLAEGANSGVKYRAEVQRQMGFVHSLGCEYQLLDDARHPDAGRGREGNRRLASLYDVLPARVAEDEPARVAGDGPAADAAETHRPGNPGRFRGVGSWNHGRIHVQDGRIAHYLNGRKVLSVDQRTPAWAAAVAASKFADRPDFCAGPRGHIVLQDHGDTVSFRSLRIRSLD